MSKAGVLRIENGERGLSLDEALAFASVLGAVPAQLVSPPEGALVMVTDKTGYDGEAVRSWFRFGDPFEEVFRAREAAEVATLERKLAIHARALVDADRGKDAAGRREAARAIIDTVLREKKEGGDGQ